MAQVEFIEGGVYPNPAKGARALHMMIDCRPASILGSMRPNSNGSVRHQQGAPRLPGRYIMQPAILESSCEELT